MKYLVAGGTGFIGRALIRSLSSEQCEIVVLTRGVRPGEQSGKARVRYVKWDGRTPGAWCGEMQSANGVINLAGTSLFAHRWSDRIKQDLVASRINATEALVRAMKITDPKPPVFISASAVGYYGDTGDREVTEDAPPGRGFLSALTVKWEAAASAATALGIRVALPRMAIALDRNGGALQKMALPFSFMVGGYLGSGTQMLPWIHLDDLVRALVFPVRHDAFNGPYNCSAPHPVTMKDFCGALGRTLHRPSWTNVPSAILKAVLGEASTMLLTGQNVVPEKLRAAGFQFDYENVDDALDSLYHT
jgi:uncharacterized protein